MASEGIDGTLSTAGEITRLLAEWTAGRPESSPELWSMVYRELRTIAAAYMRHERPDHTLRTTALVNEAYVRVFHGRPCGWESRKHFFCTMAQMMRRVLVDHARECHAQKRGGEWEKLPIEAAFQMSGAPPEQVMAVNDALEQLDKISPRQVHVVEMRFFVGLTVEQTAALLKISRDTVISDWKFAKAWLRREMRMGEAHR
jgi:RNA polymerase sigma factor (TIGR02999 family)